MKESHAHAIAESTPRERESPPEYTMTERGSREGGLDASHLIPVTSWLAGEESERAVRITIARADGRPVASALVTPAEESQLLRRWTLPSSAMDRCVFVSDVALDPDSPSGLLPALLYLCGRRGRIWDRAVLTGALLQGSSADEGAALIDLQPLARVAPLDIHGRTFALAAQRLDITIHRAWTASPAALHASLRTQLVPEVVETLERWIGRFFANPWFTAVRERTLTKEQYIYTLANLHQFVRWTTRHIGRAVGCSHDRAIRNKWLEHLQGELNHEIIIEKDLAALGADVDYVVQAMEPSMQNLQFIVTQEAMVAFHADPIIIMVSPFVAEGFAARLDQKFVDDLRATAKSWGVENPKQVTAFLASHIEFDGGDDGHWEHTHRILSDYLRTEAQVARFLNVMRLCQDAFDRSYTGYVEDLIVFGVTSPSGAT